MSQPVGTPAAKPASPGPRQRLTSLDAFRGFDILTMVFVNYIAGMPAIPFILRHAPTEMDAYTLTDLVFPGFLFMVGVSIPLALAKRREEGYPVAKILGHVLLRTLALLFLGVLTVNSERFSPADTGLSHALWYFLAYAAVFALWAVTPKNVGPGRKKLLLVLRIAAAALLLILVVLFRGKGEDGVVTWLQPSWWGILGMIGWTYLAGCLIFLAGRDNRVILAGAVGVTTALYIGGRHGALDFLGPVNALFGGGVGSIFGSHTAIVAAGMLAGTLFLPGSALSKTKDRVKSLSVLGLALLASGYVLRPLHGFSKNNGTESWALASAGISALAFLLFYIVLDAARRPRLGAFLVPAGRNPLAAYLLPDLLGSALALLGGLVHADLSRWLWPFAEKGGWPGMLNAAAVTALILVLTTLMTRSRFVLKL